MLVECRNPHVILGSSSYFAAVASAKMAAKPYWEAVKTIVCQFNDKGPYVGKHLSLRGGIDFEGPWRDFGGEPKESPSLRVGIRKFDQF